MPLNIKVMEGISRKTGLSPQEIRDLSPEQIRQRITKKTGKPFRIISEFPFIGRGNVLRDNLISSDEINRDIDKILGI